MITFYVKNNGNGQPMLVVRSQTLPRRKEILFLEGLPGFSKPEDCGHEAGYYLVERVMYYANDQQEILDYPIVGDCFSDGEPIVSMYPVVLVTECNHAGKRVDIYG